MQLIKAHPKDALARRRCSASRPATTSWPPTRRRPSTTRTSPRSSRARRRRRTRSATRRRSGSGCGESEKAIADMDSFVRFYGTRKPQDAAGVFFQMAEVYEKDKKVRRARQAPRQLPQEVGRPGRPRPPDPGALPAGRARLEGVVPARPPRTALAWRSSASPRPVVRRCIYDLNKKLKKGKKIKEAKRTQCGPPTKLEDRPLRPQQAARRPRRRSTSRPCSRSGTRAPRLRRSPARTSRRARVWRPTRSPARRSTWPRCSTRTSSASSSRRASTSSSRASTTPRRRPR